MGKHVFICHSTHDKLIAEEIRKALESKDIRCWMAPQDIPFGAEWAEAIVDAVDNSSGVVLVLSSNSNSSPQVIREIGRAVSKNVPLIPFRIDDTPLSPSMEYFLSTHQWLDALKPPLESHFQKLTDTVQRLLAREAAKEKAREEAAKAEEARRVRQAEEKARRETEEGVRKEAEKAAKEKARQKVEAARARREAEAARKAKEAKERARRETEKARKAQEEAARAKKEAEEAAKEKARQEAEAARARREAEEARKAQEYAIRVKKEAEAVLEEARREAEAAKKVQEDAIRAKEARKAQEAAIRAKKEVEAVREKEREVKEAREAQEAAIKAKKEADAAWERARLEAEEARKAQEAAIKAKKEAEAVRERTKREAEKSATTLVEQKPARAQMPAGGRKRLAKPVWLSAGIALPLLGLGIALFFVLKPLESNPIPADITELVQLSNTSVNLSKNEINGSETFYATITGHITVIEDLPVPITEASLTSQVVAELATNRATVTLNPGYTIAVKPFPSQKKETTEINQVVPLQFPPEAESGDYNVFAKIVEAKVKVGFWLDATGYLPQEQNLGSVKYIVAQPLYATISGYVRESGTSAAISGARIYAYDHDSLKGYWAGQGQTTTDSEGYYVMCPGMSAVNNSETKWTPGTYAIRVEAEGYAAEWFEDTYAKDEAKPLTLDTPDEMLSIDFVLERGSSISGKVIADSSQKGIYGMHVYAEDYDTHKWIACVNTNSDGTYTLRGLPSGTYRVAVAPSVWGQPYVWECYDNTTNYYGAKPVTVSAGRDTPGIDLSLASTVK